MLDKKQNKTYTTAVVLIYIVVNHVDVVSDKSVLFNLVNEVFKNEQSKN